LASSQNALTFQGLVLRLQNFWAGHGCVLQQPYDVEVGAGTMAAYFRERGFPAAVWSKNNQTAHQPDENCSIDNMMGNAKVFAYLFLRE